MKEMTEFIWNKQRAKDYPLDGLTVFEETSYQCDLCSGEPQCVYVCTSEAITIKA